MQFVGVVETKSPVVVTLTELARQDIGPAGGTLTGGAVTIEIPAGALSETRSVVISRLNPEAGNLPQATALAADLYALQPDDVEFAKPVTVSVAIDPSKKRGDGLGAVVLFRSTAGTNRWAPYGANDTSATTLVGTTTHFSWWAPTTAAETRCFRNMCPTIPPPRDPNGPPPGPEVLPGMDCKVPSEGPGVRCVGRGENKSAPYDCYCDGSSTILGTWQRLPPDTAITAMAAQCGGVCPANSTCDLGMVCDRAAARSWRCSTSNGSGADLRYDGGPNSVATCTCANGKSFTLPGVTADERDGLRRLGRELRWLVRDARSGDDWVCPGTIYIEKGEGCVVERRRRAATTTTTATSARRAAPTSRRANAWSTACARRPCRRRASPATPPAVFPSSRGCSFCRRGTPLRGRPCARGGGRPVGRDAREDRDEAPFAMRAPPDKSHHLVGIAVRLASVALCGSGVTACQKERRDPSPAVVHVEAQPRERDAATEEDAAAPEAPNPRLPPLAETGLIALQVPGFRDAVVSMPRDTTEARPILVALHGNYDRPEWQCDVWRKITDARPFILLSPRRPPEGSSVRGTLGVRWARSRAEELFAGLDALVDRFTDHVDDGPRIFAGFSLGAILGRRILLGSPRAFSVGGAGGGRPRRLDGRVVAALPRRWRKAGALRLRARSVSEGRRRRRARAEPATRGRRHRRRKERGAHVRWCRRARHRRGVEMVRRRRPEVGPREMTSRRPRVGLASVRAR